MAWNVMSRVTKTAWDVLSGVTKTAWDVLSGLANLCGMFCPVCKKMAWDVLSQDVLSGSRYFIAWVCLLQKKMDLDQAQQITEFVLDPNRSYLEKSKI